MPVARKTLTRRRSGISSASGSIIIHEASDRATAPSSPRSGAIGLSHHAWKGIVSHKGDLKTVLTQFGEAVRRSEDLGAGVRFTVVIEPRDQAARIEIEELAQTQPADDFDLALAEARERGEARAAEILASPDMLSADAFGAMIGVSREAVRLKRQRHEVIGLEGAKRGIRFPRWQVTGDGRLLPELPLLFEKLGGNPWTVYRFLVQRHPELDGATAADALKAGRIEQVLAAADNARRAFS